MWGSETTRQYKPNKVYKETKQTKKNNQLTKSEKLMKIVHLKIRSKNELRSPLGHK